MILAEPRGAAVARDAAGAEARFDDLGCLRRRLADTGADGWAVWVSGGATAAGEARWLPAAEAWFAVTATRTPMGSGLLAYASRVEAAAGAAAGEPVSWGDLLASGE
jgi:hypothetical protein